MLESASIGPSVFAQLARVSDAHRDHATCDVCRKAPHLRTACGRCGQKLSVKQSRLKRTAGTSYGPASVCVCLSVCLSEVGVILKWLDGWMVVVVVVVGWTDRAGFWHGGLFIPVLWRVLKESRLSTKMGGTSLRNIFVNSKISPCGPPTDRRRASFLRPEPQLNPGSRRFAY